MVLVVVYKAIFSYFTPACRFCNAAGQAIARSILPFDQPNKWTHDAHLETHVSRRLVWANRAGVHGAHGARSSFRFGMHHVSEAVGIQFGCNVSWPLEITRRIRQTLPTGALAVWQQEVWSFVGKMEGMQGFFLFLFRPNVFCCDVQKKERYIWNLHSNTFFFKKKKTCHPATTLKIVNKFELTLVEQKEVQELGQNFDVVSLLNHFADAYCCVNHSIFCSQNLPT